MIDTPKGTCEKHGWFTLRDGCPGCLAERRKAGITPAMDELQDGLEQEGYTLAHAEESAAETAIALRPGEDMEAHGYFEEALRALDYAEKRVITTIEHVKAATDDLALISKLKKVMENKRRSLLDPLKLQAEAIRETYSSLMDPIIKADRITREKMLAFQQEQARIRQEQEAINREKAELAAREAALNGREVEPVELVEVTPEAPKRVETDMGTTGMVDHWKYEVVDPLAVPREYLMVDTAMLSAIAKRHHDQKPVPGVRFYNEPIIAVRAR